MSLSAHWKRRRRLHACIEVIIAVQALARQVTAEDLAAGCIYPDVRNLRDISLLVARAVAQKVRCIRPATWLCAAFGV